MNNARRLVAMLGCVSLAAASHALAQPADDGAVRNVADMKLAAFPGMPTCTTGSVQSGDPGKGPSVIFAKMQAGCVFPWHWHTPVEHVMVVSGSARIEMRGGKPAALHAGGFAEMPSHHVHRFACEKACQLYVYADAPFDLHYVDDKDAEIPPDEALKKVKEIVAHAPK